MVGRGTQRGAGGAQRRSARRTAASSAASSAGTVATQDNKEEALSESELQVPPEEGNEEDFTGNGSDAGDDSFQETEDQLLEETEMEGEGTVGEEGEEVEEGGEELEETGGGDEQLEEMGEEEGDEDYLGEGDEQLEEMGEEGEEESFYVEEDEQPEETGDASEAEGDEVVDEAGGFDEDQAIDDFDQEGLAEEDANFEEEGDDVEGDDGDADIGEGADIEGDDGDADIGGVEERTGEASESESKTEVGTSQAKSAGEKEEKPEKPEAEAGTGEEKVEDMSTDQQDDRTDEKEEGDASTAALKDKDTLVTTGEETAEEKAKRIELDKDSRWKWSLCIPPVFTGPCFDKNCFQYRIRIRPVVLPDLQQSSLIDITKLAHSTHYEHPDKAMELFVLGKNIEKLFENILFCTFRGNHMTITIERRQSSAKGEQSTSQLQELIKEPTDFSRVINTVTFKQRNAYTRRSLRRVQGRPGQNVKHRSLFLHNLPPSIDKNFLRILFPLSQKAGMVNVSDDVRSAVLEMNDKNTAYHHLICFTDLFIDGRNIQMGILDMSQEEALKEFEKGISDKTVAKSGRHAEVQKYKTHTVSAKEAQRQEVEKAFSSLEKNSKENQKTSAGSSSHSSGGKTSHSKGEEKSAGSKKVAVNKQEDEKREKERKDRERKERERKDKERREREKRERDRREREQRERRQQREQEQKGRNQRGGKQVPDRSRRTDGAQQPRGTDRARQRRQDWQRRGEQHRDFERQNQFDREYKRQKEAEERELKKIMHEQELERHMYLKKLQMEQFQELERQKLIREEKEVKMQLLMQEQELQMLAREEAARKLQEMEEQQRREREREQKRKFEQEREQIEERARERYREMERNREREQVRQREQEWERAKQKERAERMQNLHQQQRMLQEEDQPARKRSRWDISMHEQGGRRNQMGFSAQQPRRGNQRSPARPSATATSGQDLLGSPPRTAPPARQFTEKQVPQGVHLKQSLEKEVAKQAEELKRKLALLEELQMDPSSVASERIQINPSRGSGSGSTGTGRRDYANTGQQHVRGAEPASLGRQMHRDYEPPSLLGEVPGSFDRGDHYGGNLRQENYNRMTMKENDPIPMAAMRHPEQDRQLRGQPQYGFEPVGGRMRMEERAMGSNRGFQQHPEAMDYHPEAMDHDYRVDRYGHGGGYRPDFY